LAQLAKAGFDPVYGARPLKRAIQQSIENPLAKQILEGKFAAKDAIRVEYRGGSMHFEKAATKPTQKAAARYNPPMFVADSKRLTQAGAKKIVDTAVAKAKQAGISISVVVADSGGNLLALERMDGGRFHTVHSATTKAVCCASNKRPTSSHGAQGQQLDVA